MQNLKTLELNAAKYEATRQRVAEQVRKADAAAKQQQVVAALPPPTVSKRKLPHVYSVAQSLQEIFSTNAWNNIVKIDGGEQGVKLKTGLLKYLIPFILCF